MFYVTGLFQACLPLFIMSHPHWLHLTLSGVAAHVILQAVYNTFECVVLYWLCVVTGKAPRVTEARRTNEGFA